MARRFVRVDLKADARDFVPVAVEPGVPLLDSAGTNAKFLFRWLGELVAEPELEGESVDFHVLDAEGGRLEEVACEPATEQDLAGALSGDLELLRERIRGTRPETATQRALLKILKETFESQVAGEGGLQASYGFFKYRDVLNRWRLVWCWGFRRRDRAPGQAIVCGHSACNLLLVQRAGERAECPGCEAAAAVRAAPVKQPITLERRMPWRRYLLVGLLLLAVVAVLMHWIPNRNEPTIAEATLPPEERPKETSVSPPTPPVDEAPAENSPSDRESADVDEMPIGVDEMSADVDEMPAGASPADAERPAEVKTGSDRGPPVEVPVGTEFDEPLRVAPDTIRMRVGEMRRIGVDLGVSRGGVDLSRQARVTPDVPEVVQYAGESHALLAVSPGVSAVTFAWGDKLAQTTVQVLPAETERGNVVVEPATAGLSPGQALELRAFLVTEGGRRSDRTGAAVFTSSSPECLAILGSVARALSPGAAEITATLPESEEAGVAQVTVDDEPLVDLFVEPASLAMSVGDRAKLGIFGQSAGGTQALFPQADLRVTSGGADPQAIRVVDSREIEATAPGEAEVSIAWQDRLLRVIPVRVTLDAWTELVIHPNDATIRAGEGLIYRVTGVRGGRRHVVQPGDGLRLSVGDLDVARAINGQTVLGVRPGQTPVVAHLGDRRAEATLTVAANGDTTADAAGKTAPAGPDGAVVADAETRTIYGPDGAVAYEAIDEKVVGPHGLRNAYFAADTSVPDQQMPGEPAPADPVPEGTMTMRPEKGGAEEEAISIKPAVVSLRIGESSPAFTVVARGEGGGESPVAATLESLDPEILAADDSRAGRFVARSFGQTQVRAVYRGQEAFAEATVTGDRFAVVRTSLRSGEDDFSVSIEVLAAKSEGPLEYRVFAADSAPPEAWVPAEAHEDLQRVELTSEALGYRGRRARYSLILEARVAGRGSIERYPFAFRLEPRIIVER